MPQPFGLLRPFADFTRCRAATTPEVPTARRTAPDRGRRGGTSDGLMLRWFANTRASTWLDEYPTSNAISVIGKIRPFEKLAGFLHPQPRQVDPEAARRGFA